jgi:hypothetical protein
MQDLKTYIKEYRNIDDEVRRANKVVSELRDSRKTIESKITTILRRPEFAGYDKLKIEDDGSTIKVQRPNEWNKPWSLSKKDLEQALALYFNGNAERTTECFNYIIEHQKKKLVATEFAITRTVPNENMDIE